MDRLDAPTTRWLAFCLAPPFEHSSRRDNSTPINKSDIHLSFTLCFLIDPDLLEPCGPKVVSPSFWRVHPSFGPRVFFFFFSPPPVESSFPADWEVHWASVLLAQASGQLALSPLGWRLSGQQLRRWSRYPREKGPPTARGDPFGKPTERILITTAFVGYHGYLHGNPQRLWL